MYLLLSEGGAFLLDQFYFFVSHFGMKYVYVSFSKYVYG